jgi:hypothetical protein
MRKKSVIAFLIPFFVLSLSLVVGAGEPEEVEIEVRGMT